MGCQSSGIGEDVVDVADVIDRLNRTPRCRPLVIFAVSGDCDPAAATAGLDRLRALVGPECDAAIVGGYWCGDVA
jgi:hypothetical protein